MTITIAQIKNAEPVLTKLFNEKLPVKISFRINKIINSITKDLENFETFRMKLFEKYGEIQNDSTRMIKPEHQEAFLQEINSLLREEVELPDVKLGLEELGDIQITPAELSAFAPWLTDAE